MFQAGAKCKLPSGKEREPGRGEPSPAAPGRAARTQRRGLMLALQVITAIRTKPAKLLLIPFLLVLKVFFPSPLRTPPPLRAFPCVRQTEEMRSRRKLLAAQQNAGLNSLADCGCEIHGGRSIGAPEPRGMSSGGCFTPHNP